LDAAALQLVIRFTFVLVLLILVVLFNSMVQWFRRELSRVVQLRTRSNQAQLDGVLCYGYAVAPWAGVGEQE